MRLLSLKSSAQSYGVIMRGEAKDDTQAAHLAESKRKETGVHDEHKYPGEQPINLRHCTVIRLRLRNIGNSQLDVGRRIEGRIETNDLDNRDGQVTFHNQVSRVQRDDTGDLPQLDTHPI